MFNIFRVGDRELASSKSVHTHIDFGQRRVARPWVPLWEGGDPAQAGDHMHTMMYPGIHGNCRIVVEGLCE